MKIKLGVICEFGKNCGLVEEKYQSQERICNGEHTFSDFKEGVEYTTVIVVPQFRKGLYNDVS